jgi:hypothetical protein
MLVENLSAKPEIQPWQIEQASEALRLLCQMFLGLDWAAE